MVRSTSSFDRSFLTGGIMVGSQTVTRDDDISTQDLLSTLKVLPDSWYTGILT